MKKSLVENFFDMIFLLILRKFIILRIVDYVNPDETCSLFSMPTILLDCTTEFLYDEYSHSIG